MLDRMQISYPPWPNFLEGRMQLGACEEYIQEAKELRLAIIEAAILLVSKYSLAFGRKCATMAHVPCNLPE